MDPTLVNTIVDTVASGAMAGLGKVGETMATGAARDTVKLYRRLREKLIGILENSGADAVDAIETDPSSQQALDQLTRLLLNANPTHDVGIAELVDRLNQQLTASSGGVSIGQNQVQGDQNLTTIDTVNGPLHIGYGSDEANPS